MRTHHTIDYIELTATDMDAAKAFYTDAFGWEFAEYGPDYAGIKGAGIKGAEREVGGIIKGDTVVRGGPLVVLYSEDLARSIHAVKEAGGEIVAGPFDFPGGRRFQFTDPSGNELAVWSPA